MSSDTPKTEAPSGGTPAPSFAGGLSPAPKGQLQPVFTLLMTWVFVDVLALLVVPYSLHRGTDHLWAQPQRLAFMALAILGATVFGVLAGVFADRRGHSAWWYLAGHLGAWVAPVLIAVGFFEENPLVSRLVVTGASALGALLTLVLVGSRQRSERAPLSALTQKLGALCYGVGSIKLGIVLMVILVAALGYGTEMENQYGGRAAKAIVYTSGWLSLIFVLTTASLVSATLRKYPWRIDQAGWITIHSALVLLVVGAFLTFWGKKEGNLELREGDKSAEFVLSTETRLEVYDRSGKRLWSELASFDRNPADKEPMRRYEVDTEEGRLFSFTVDRYFGNGKLEPSHHNDGPMRRSALRLAAITQKGERPVFLQEGRPQFPFGQFIAFRTLGQVDDARYEALIAGKLSPKQGMTLDFAYRGEGDWFALMHAPKQKPRRVDFERGKEAAIGPAFRFRVDELFTHHRRDETWSFDGYQPAREVARIQVEGEETPRWLSLTQRGRNACQIRRGDAAYHLVWRQGRHQLGFELELIDFHRDFYPGSMTAKTYESHLVLRHPKKYPDGAKITIDMNHPLVLDGWRLYQHRFSSSPEMESTILQVNNDPGLGPTYFGCIVLGLGLVVAFFQKPFLRAVGRLLKARRKGPQFTLLFSCLALVACALGTLPGMLVFWGLEDGPIMLLGVLAVILGLVAETQFVNRWIKPRVERSLEALKATPTPSVGES